MASVNSQNDLRYNPPWLPDYLSSTYELKPIVGVPRDEEVKVIHAVIRAVNGASQIPALNNPDLLMQLTQHLFDVQMAIYRSRYSFSVFPEDTMFTPPAFPSQLPITLGTVIGSPSDEQLKLVYNAMRALEGLANFPSLYDPDLNMNLSQHFFDIQLARHLRQSTRGKFISESNQAHTETPGDAEPKLPKASVPLNASGTSGPAKSPSATSPPPSAGFEFGSSLGSASGLEGKDNVSPATRPFANATPDLEGVAGLASTFTNDGRVITSGSATKTRQPSTRMERAETPKTNKLPKPNLPVTNIVTPPVLKSYLPTALQILVLDVRPRDEFEARRLPAENVVCIEPVLLRRKGMSAKELREALVLSSRTEQILFERRYTFDLVVLCDDSSNSFGDPSTPLGLLFRIIYETEFLKPLRRPPAFLLGGIKAWANEVGEFIVSQPEEDAAVAPSADASKGLSRKPAVPTTRPVDYPNPIRPPQTTIFPAVRRVNGRPQIPQPTKLPQFQPNYQVVYWRGEELGMSGLKNMGNTCYMNSVLQCLSGTVPFVRFFTDRRWQREVNMMNPLGTRGELAGAFYSLFRDMWQGELPYLAPIPFRQSICQHARQFIGSEQHDAQEFMISLLDGLHEDLNRIIIKPQFEELMPEREAELERMPKQLAGAYEWARYRRQNDSIVVDYFQGQFCNQMQCLTCGETSTTFNTFLSLSLPIPIAKGVTKVSLSECINALVNREVMDNADAWHCPRCKAARRAAKQLTFSRMPPVLVIHLKRFSSMGPLTEKLETLVDFPLKDLDFTKYMPPPLTPNIDKDGLEHFEHGTDPRAQVPPYRYELYGVTNHFCNLSSEHYTAFIKSRAKWMHCDDSRITIADPKEVVGKSAYMLFYKRVPPGQ